ncbi:unnamed protein product [Chrysodeixis includens]|uniref:Uncharacterized protein n=1 Tax=Chrysodeixis includens TaxID=689277 RepID=A0A9N8L0I3_CHRIL|nr:unnamed protein product [Chrysodeixis includens]
MKTTSAIRFAIVAAVLLASANVDASKTDRLGPFKRPSASAAIGMIMCLAKRASIALIMKSTSAIRFAVVAAVLLASANVDASKTDRLGPFKRPSASAAIGMIMCLAKIAIIGDFSLGSVLSCLTGLSKPVAFLAAEETYRVEITVTNGEFLSENGLIMNSHLKFGTWEKDNAAVESVDNIAFNKDYARFSAVDLTNNINGVAGYFEIHENGKAVAKVLFDAPRDAEEDRIIVRSLDKDYLCSDNWHYDPHLIINVICYSVKV